MKVTCIKKREDLPAKADWNRLAGDSPFRSWEWLSSWWGTYGSTVELLTPLVHSDAGELIAIAPWYIDISRSRGRVVKMFGDGKVCSDYVGLIVDSRYTLDVIRCLGEWMNQSGSGEFGRERNWDAIEIDGVAANDTVVPRMLDAMQLGSEVKRTSIQNTWRVPLPSAWDEYLAGRSKRRRNVLRRIERNYILSGRAEIQFAKTPDQVRTFLASLIRLHTLRRGELGCDGCFSHDRFDKFLELAALRLLDSNKLWLTQMTLDGEVASNSFGMEHGGSVYLYQCGFAPKFNEHKPGWIQNIFNLQHAVERNIEVFDFLRGDEDYKSQLGGEPTELVRYRAAAPTVVSRVRHQVAALAKSAIHSLPINTER